MAWTCSTERDILILRLDKAEKEVEELVEELRTQTCSIHVQQGLGDQTQIEFSLPRVRRDADGEIDFVHEAASAKVDEGNPDELRLALSSVENEQTTEDVPADDLKAVTFSVGKGRVAWESALAETPS